MLLYETYFAPYFTVLTNTPRHILEASVMLLAVMESFALRGNMFDGYVMVAFGILGYLIRTHGFPVIPTVLASILGTQAEKGLDGTMAISYGKNIFLFMLARPISLFPILLTIMSVAFPIYHPVRGRERGRKTTEPEG